MKSFVWMLAGVLGSASSSFAGWEYSPSASPELAKAHSLVLEKDFLGAVQAARTALQESNNDSQVAANVNALFSTMTDLPCDWRVPEGVVGLKVTQRARKNGEGDPRYILRVGANVVAADHVNQLQVIRYPNEVVLDLQAGIGELEQGSFEGEPFFDLRTERRAAPFPEGLYLLNISTQAGQSVEGWFILQDMVTSTFPMITEPTRNAVVTTGSPRISWLDYRSPEYRDGEFRNMTIAMRFVRPDDEWEDRWEDFYSGTIPTTVTVGQGGETAAPLQDGNHVISLSYREGRRFGDLRLRREATTIHPVVVDLP
jgi:hypothetical protein